MKNKENVNKSIHNKKSVLKSCKYFFENTYFDSSWELAYYIFLRDSNKNFEYHPNVSIDYIEENGITHQYFPDFIVDGVFHEIKGNQFFNDKNEPFNIYRQEFWWDKYNALLDNGVVIIREKEILDILDFVKNRYGKNFIKECKIN